jgi:predicted deacetylase
MIEKGTGLIWTGSNLPSSLQSYAGLKLKENSELPVLITEIQYEQGSTKVFNESLIFVTTQGAQVQGYFVDQRKQSIAPAELCFRKEGCGLVYYFAYDVCSWWSADLDMPWLRAYRLDMAIDAVLSDDFWVTLSPYPRNLKSAFVTRIEDVDPLHTSTEWLKRADDFLSYYSSRNFALTIALSPRYIDPEQKLDIELVDDSAANIRSWLSTVILRGGTIVQHGYTHQLGSGKTAVRAEFFDEKNNQWLSLEEQRQNIQNGSTIIEQSLGFTPRGFEAPHYIANNSTYQALDELGFSYTTHNSDTPFLDQYGYGGLVNVPETLGYLPLNADNKVELKITSNMDILYNMSAVMLYFNHLFDDSASQMGRNLLDYATAKSNLWITNTQKLTDFYLQRINAMDKMNVHTETDGIVVELGACNKAGLTLRLNNAPEIKAVTINGQEWSTYNQDYIILPPLTSPSNTITINLQENNENVNLQTGYIALCLSVASAFLIFPIISVKKPRQLWRKANDQKPSN